MSISSHAEERPARKRKIPMAHLLPADINKLEVAENRSPEYDTLSLLESGLPNEYTAFHSVNWTSVSERRTAFGEIDFVIVNQAGDVLVIEQKNGGLEETDAGLIKHYGEEDKSVVGQLNRSLNQIRSKFQFQHGRDQEPNYHYIFYCPDYRVKKLNAAGLDANCIVDSNQDRKLCEAIVEILGPGNPNSQKHKRSIEFFAQSYNLVLDIHARHAGLNRRYRELASNLVEVINNLEMSPFLLRVSGTAGSGKSLLAAEFYQRQLAQQNRVLFLCFNRPLLDQLLLSLPEGGVINTWLGFVQLVLKSHGLDVTPDGTNDFWNTRLEVLVDLGISDVWQFDALVVDEGQDFEEMWWLVLKENFLKRDASVLWLEDPDQNVRGIDWQHREFPVAYHARKNFRSPYRVAQYIQETLPFEFEVGNGIRGLGVNEHRPENDKELLSTVDRLVKSWIAAGFSEDKIVILTCHGLERSILFSIDKIGNRSVRKFTGEYSNEGDQLYTEGQLRFESVRRFKGQQAAVIILVDVDLLEDEKLLEKQRLVFTGMTRASMRLEVIFKANDQIGK